MAELDSFPNQQPQDSDEVVAAHDSNGDGTLDDTVNWTWSGMKAALDSAGYARLGQNETFTNGLNITGGNVGIGTTSPSYAVDVAGTTATDGVRSEGGSDTFGNSTSQRQKVFAESGIVIDSARSAEITGDCKRTQAGKTILNLFGRWNGGDPVTTIKMATGDDTTNEDDGRIFLRTKPSGGSIQTRLQIEPNGNVGIGTTSPSYALDTAGGIRAQDKLLTDFSDPSTFSAREVKSGTSAPSDSEGKNGDIYIQTN